MMLKSSSLPCRLLQCRNIHQGVISKRKTVWEEIDWFRHAKLMRQVVVLSDGSSFTTWSTSPRPLVQLTKDTRNSPLWNPKMRVLDDQSGRLKQFSERFGLDASSEVDSSASLDDMFGVTIERTVKPKKEVVVEAPTQTKGKKKK